LKGPCGISVRNIVYSLLYSRTEIDAYDNNIKCF